MTGELLFVLAIVGIAGIVVAIIQVGKNQDRIKKMILDRLNVGPEAEQVKPPEPEPESEQPVTEREPKVLTAEEKSKAELESLQGLIKDRKQIAWDTDISHHLWNLYKNHFPRTGLHSLDSYDQDEQWYNLKILQVSTQNNLNTYEFELNETRYKFIDDEEGQSWHLNMKYFSLFLYDDSGRCLIDIPMKLKVDRWGRNYSVSATGPNAFLPGGWTSDFINVTLKHQRIHNKEIRAQKHQERLWEIEDLKDRFGISD